MEFRLPMQRLGRLSVLVQLLDLVQSLLIADPVMLVTQERLRSRLLMSVVFVRVESIAQLVQWQQRMFRFLSRP